jgi:hypothetical protein
VADGIAHDIKAGLQFQHVAAVEELNRIGAGTVSFKTARNHATVNDGIGAGADNANSSATIEAGRAPNDALRADDLVAAAGAAGAASDLAGIY